MRTSLLLSSALIYIALNGCTDKVMNAANFDAAQCNKYESLDKKHWCLGQCEKVVDEKFRQMCYRLKRSPS